MAGFFNQYFFNQMKTAFENSINAFQYEVEGTWYNATINNVARENNVLVYDVLIPAIPERAHKITGIRALSNAGIETGNQLLNIDRNGTQDLLAVFEFPIQEV